MHYRRLGQTDLEVSVVGIGGWAMGGLARDWGPVDDNEAIAAIREGIDRGITLIDTAPSYGYGHAEEVVGRAIAGRREKLVIASKCGLAWKEPGGRLERCLRSDSIRRECEASLRRLRVETIDLYQVQAYDPQTAPTAWMATLTQLREEGKIRAIGVSNFSVDQVAEARRHGRIHAIEPELSLLRRDALDDLLPYAAECGLGVVTYGSLAHGLLTGKFTASSPFTDQRASDPEFQGERFRENLRRVEQLREIAGQTNRTPAQLALRWVIQQRGVSSAMAGAKRASQVRENAAAGSFELPPDVMQRLDHILS